MPNAFMSERGRSRPGRSALIPNKTAFPNDANNDFETNQQLRQRQKEDTSIKRKRGHFYKTLTYRRILLKRYLLGCIFAAVVCFFFEVMWLVFGGATLDSTWFS